MANPQAPDAPFIFFQAEIPVTWLFHSNFDVFGLTGHFLLHLPKKLSKEKGADNVNSSWFLSQTVIEQAMRPLSRVVEESMNSGLHCSGLPTEGDPSGSCPDDARTPRTVRLHLKASSTFETLERSFEHTINIVNIHNFDRNLNDQVSGDGLK
jgi:hypothetical protein